MQASRKRLFLIDGPASVYQAFHAIRDLTGEDGMPTNALFGFTAMLRKLVREQRPELLAVAWDHRGPTFRHEIADDYKGTRPPMPEDLAVQIDCLRDLIGAYRIPFLELAGYEADDIMATLAVRGEAAELDVVLVTRDKDCKQLLSPHVTIFDSKNEVFYDAAKLEADTGLTPEQWIDYQSLVGDSTDNIKGVPGIGEKTALKLLAQWPSVTEIYSHLEEVEPKRTRGLLESGRESAELARELVTLKTDVAVDLELDSLVYVGPDNEALAPIFRKHGFRRFLEDTGAAAPSRKQAKGEYTLVAEVSDLAPIAAELRRAKRISVVALPGGPASTASIAGLGLSWQAGAGCYVPLASPTMALPVEAVKEALAPILRGDSPAKASHDSKVAAQALARIFFDGEIDDETRFDDTTLMAYLLSSTTRGYNLDVLSLQVLDYRAIPPSEVLGRGKQAVTFDHAPLPKVCEFAAESADLVLRLRETLAERLAQAELEGVYRDVELPLVPVLARLEMHGMLIDVGVLEAMSKELTGEISTIEEQAHAEAGEEFNLGSTKQLQHILFEVRGLEPVKRGKTGPSTDADSLEQIHSTTDDPLCGLILRYRELTKLKSTYVDALPQLVCPETGRIHTVLHQAVAATGRLSSSDPNLQNIPVRTELGRRIRHAFVAPPGHRLVSGDYSQIELRVLAHYSGDENLIAAFEGGEDIHRRVAAQVAGVGYDEVDSEMRQRAKATNFGIIYGQSAFGLSRQLGIPRGEAAKFIEGYFAEFPGVRAWIDSTLEQAGADGEVRTLAGRRRPIPDMHSRNRQRRGLAERTAVNTVIQGSAADIIKEAMIKLDRRLREEGRPERIVLQIHDELLLEAPDEAAEEAARVLAEELSGIVELRVPLVVNTAVANDWGALEK